MEDTGAVTLPSKSQLLDQLKSKARRIELIGRYWSEDRRSYVEHYRYYWVEDKIARSDIARIRVFINDDDTEEAFWEGNEPIVLRPRTTSISSEEAEEILAKHGARVLEILRRTPDYVVARCIVDVDDQTSKQVLLAVIKTESGYAIKEVR